MKGVRMAKFVSCTKGCTMYTHPKVERVDRNGEVKVWKAVVASKKGGNYAKKVVGKKA